METIHYNAHVGMVIKGLAVFILVFTLLLDINTIVDDIPAKNLPFVLCLNAFLLFLAWYTVWSHKRKYIHIDADGITIKFVGTQHFDWDEVEKVYLNNAVFGIRELFCVGKNDKCARFVLNGFKEEEVNNILSAVDYYHNVSKPATDALSQPAPQQESITSDQTKEASSQFKKSIIRTVINVTIYVIIANVIIALGIIVLSALL